MHWRRGSSDVPKKADALANLLVSPNTLSNESTSVVC